MNPQSNEPSLEPVPGPVAHEDTTLAEQLRDRHVAEEDEAGMVAFRFGADDLVKLPALAVSRFLEEYGPLHPGDYTEQTGGDWRDDFRGLVS